MTLLGVLASNHVSAKFGQALSSPQSGDLLLSLEYTNTVMMGPAAQPPELTLYKSGLCIYIEESQQGPRQLLTIKLSAEEAYSLRDEVIALGVFDVVPPTEPRSDWLNVPIEFSLHIRNGHKLHELTANALLIKESVQLKAIISLLTDFGRDAAEPYRPVEAILEGFGSFEEPIRGIPVKLWPLAEDCLGAMLVLLEGPTLDAYLRTAGHGLDGYNFNSGDRFYPYRYLPLLPNSMRTRRDLETFKLMKPYTSRCRAETVSK